MVIDIGYLKKVAKRLLAVLITIIAIYIAFKMAVFYMPFLIAFVISTIAEPIIKKLHKNSNFTRKTCAIIVLAIMFCIIVGLLIWGVTMLIEEGSNLLSSLNYYIDEGYNYISKGMDKFNNMHLSAEIEEILRNSGTNIIETVSNWIAKTLTTVISNLSSIGTIGVYIVVTILATYFICTDRLYILDQLEHHFPKDWVKKITKSTKKIIKMLGCYLKAEVILITINFILVLIRIICI